MEKNENKRELNNEVLPKFSIGHESKSTSDKNDTITRMIMSQLLCCSSDPSKNCVHLSHN